MTSNEHTSAITAIGKTDRHQAGTASTTSAAWMAAVAAGRVALLAGYLDTLAISINGNVEALLDPARDDAGRVDVEALTAALVEMYQSVTIGEVLAALVPRA